MNDSVDLEVVLTSEGKLGGEIEEPIDEWRVPMLLMGVFPTVGVTRRPSTNLSSPEGSMGGSAGALVWSTVRVELRATLEDILRAPMEESTRSFSEALDKTISRTAPG
jgi:hypothetical protein